MTYAIRKRQAGQEVVKKLTFYLNKCKFTAPPYSDNIYFHNDNLLSSSSKDNVL